MLKYKDDFFEVHQNIINYGVSIKRGEDIIKEYNPRKWISMEEAEEMVREINESKK